MKRIVITAGMIFLAAAVGCSKKSKPEEENAAPAQKPGTPSVTDAAASAAAGVFVSTKPAGKPVSITESRSLPAGSEVLLNASVRGNKTPFVEGRAAFIVGDDSLAPCPEGEGCPTPWDTCCYSIDVKVKATAAIQLIGKDGAVLPLGVKGINGLKELSRVTVSGIVAPNSSAESFVVNAKAIFVESE